MSPSKAPDRLVTRDQEWAQLVGEMIGLYEHGMRIAGRDGGGVVMPYTLLRRLIRFGKPGTKFGDEQ